MKLVIKFEREKKYLWTTVCKHKVLIYHTVSFKYVILCFNPNLPGGGAIMAPPPVVFLTVRLYHSKFRTLLSWLFSFKFPAHFDTKFVTPGGTVLKLRNFLYMHVGPKMAPKCDFVYKINANWFFSHSSHLYAYFYSQWLKWIYFSIIVLQKVSATNFTEKNNKNKRSKNKEIHKKFIKQWNT